MKNLVLSVAKGYDWYTLEPFVNSFAKNCPSAELVLFVDDISDFTRDKLLRGGVLSVDVPAEYKSVLIINARWKFYLDFLESHEGEYEQVFISDVRDVIFQADVFESFKDRTNFLGYALEADDIRGSKTGADANYIWLASFFGKNVADKLAEQRAICCGTVIGSFNEMKTFCQIMWDALKTDTAWGHEQAYMNYIIRENRLPIENLIEIDVDDGAIYTNGIIENNPVQGDKILRGDGGIPAVVHQYDRHKELVRLVDETYHDKNFSFDERFTDPRSFLEQIVQLLYVDKLNDAARFFTEKIFDRANFDGNIDALLKIWQNVSDKPLSPESCYLEISVQHALMSVRTFTPEHLKKICSLLNQSTEKNHTVVHPAKVFVYEALRAFAEQGIKMHSAEICFDCLDLIKSLNLPPDKKFYLLAAKANRIFGRNDEALAAYKKALDLN